MRETLMQRIGHRAYRFARRIPALMLGSVLGWLCAGMLLWGNEDAKPNAKPKSEPKKLAAEYVFSKFPDWVGSVAFSADDSLAAAGSYDVVKVFNLADKKEVASLPHQAGMIKALAFAPDGQIIASGGYQTVGLWNVTTKTLVKSLDEPQAQVTSLAISPNGALLVCGSEDELVRVYDLPAGTLKSTLEGHGRPVTSVGFSHDGSKVVSAGSDVTRPTKPGVIKVWDAATGKETLSFEAHDKSVTTVAFTVDDKWIVSGSFDETVRLWNANDGKQVQEYGEHIRAINSVFAFPDNQHIASASGGRNKGGNEAHIWSLKGGVTLGVLEGHDGPVQQVVISHDGRKALTASMDKTAALWDVGALVGLKPKTDKTVAAAAPSTDKPTTDKPTTEKPGPEKPAVEKPAAKPEPGKPADEAAKPKELRAGIIGLDTSHVVAFTEVLNAKEPKAEVAGCRVVAAYPQGSPDIKSSTERVPGYTEALKKQGVEIVDSIDALLEKVDVVFLETNDGRPHFDQLLPCLKKGKPTFIDKPIAGSLSDAVAIFEAARKYKVPVFSSSSLRFATGTLAVRAGKVGKVLGCDTFGPCSLESTHPDLYWYGIHGVEALFTVMGPGCESVSRISTPNFELAAGKWKDGRIGTFRGMRVGGGYGGNAFGEKGIEPVGKSEGYAPLVFEVVKFFRTGVVPVSEEETLDIYAFMEAADESKRQGGAPVKLETVLAKARDAAQARLAAAKVAKD